MMNMLYGLLQPTSGKILIRGKEVTMNSPIDAIANGDWNGAPAFHAGILPDGCGEHHPGHGAQEGRHGRPGFCKKAGGRDGQEI